MTTIADVATNFMSNMRGVSPSVSAAKGYKAGMTLGQRTRALDQADEQSKRTKTIDMHKMAQAEKVALLERIGGQAMLATTPEKWEALKLSEDWPEDLKDTGFEDREAVILLSAKGKDYLDLGAKKGKAKWEKRKFAQQQALEREKMNQPKQPLVQVNTGSEAPPYKIPAGFMLKDTNDPSKGVTPIPGGPKDAVTGETAGKAQMMRTAQKQLETVKSLAFDNDGSPNWANISNAFVNTPKTEGRKLRTAMEYGIQAITRIETGAAMPPAEVTNTRKRFQPSPGDTDEVVKMKLDMFEDFIGGTLKLLDPAGRFDEERFNQELEQRKGPSQEDLEFTAQQHGITVDEVKRRLGL